MSELGAVMPAPDADPPQSSSRHRVSECKDILLAFLESTIADFNTVSVRMFAKSVWKFSKLNTGAGYHHERIAQFLSRLMETPDGEFQPSNIQEDFLTLYRFGRKPENLAIPASTPGGETQGNTSNSSVRWQLQHAHHCRSCLELHQLKTLAQFESPGQIFFLKGYPSPEWLGLIGSKYHVDPEYFSRFLDFRSTHDVWSRISVPFLPSCEWNIIELSMTTIGLMNPLASYGQQADLAKIRQHSAAVLDHINGDILRNPHVPSVGCTMIRAIHVLDQTHFAIEQKISICFKPAQNEKGWLGKRISFSTLVELH